MVFRCMRRKDLLLPQSVVTHQDNKGRELQEGAVEQKQRNDINLQMPDPQQQLTGREGIQGSSQSQIHQPVQ